MGHYAETIQMVVMSTTPTRSTWVECELYFVNQVIEVDEGMVEMIEQVAGDK